MSLREKVALVTGSVHGIGAEVARRFAGEGARIGLNSVSSVEAGQRFAEDLPDAIYIQGDVADEQDARRIVDAVLERYGRLDVLVNNAGITRRVPLDDIEAVTTETWRAIFDVNVFGLWNVTRAAVPALRESGDGVILNLSSIAGVRPSGSSIPYAVSKAAVNHLTELLAKVLGPEIRVNAVAPGYITTRWNEGQQERLDFIVSHTPAQRPGAPEDVAELCVGLVAASYVTGVTVIVDGGLQLIR